MKISIKLRVFSDRLYERSHGGGGGGGEGGEPGADGRGVGISWVGGNSAVGGGGAIVWRGVNIGGVFNL